MPGRSGRRSLPACQHNETLGVQRNGAMQEYILLPWEKVIPAGKLSARDSALVEPMSVGFHAVSRAGVTDADVVMVIGCGMVGMGAIVRAALRGATVIAADLDDEKLDLARTMGAAYAINTRRENVHERLQEISGGMGPDVVIEAVGSVPTYQMAIDEVAFTVLSSFPRRRPVPSLSVSISSSRIWKLPWPALRTRPTASAA